MKKILITGGAGFIGSHLASYLLKQGCIVTILDKNPFKPSFHCLSQARIVEGDVLSAELLKSLLLEVDTCFHLAALSSVAGCALDSEYSHLNNVVAFNTLLKQIQQIKVPIKLVYASSSAVYGNNTQLPLHEELRPMPTSAYAADKLSNELYASVLYQVNQLPSVGLRFFNVYGPGQLASNPYSGVITCFKNAIEHEKSLTIYGDGEQTRDFIFVEDVLQALCAAAKTPDNFFGIFNVCTGKSISINHLAEVMIKASNKSLKISYENARPGDLLHSLGCSKHIFDSLGFKATTTIKTGLEIFLKS